MLFQYKAFRMKQFSELAGVSIKTLRHYEKIGLLAPERMNDAGYRRYSKDDLFRLQEIQFFRELDFGLAEIKSIIESPGYRRDEALASQKELLTLKIKRLNTMIRTIDKTLQSEEMGIEMANDELFGGLVDDETLEEYAKEAKERWGGTDAYKESERKTARYTKKDWERINGTSSDIYIKIADLMDGGADPGDAEVQAQTKRWYDHITDSFYTCTPEIFRGLGEMYVADHRFTENIDKVRPGLAAFLKDAMKIYADSVS